jgi:hypothetical protein
VKRRPPERPTEPAPSSGHIRDRAAADPRVRLGAWTVEDAIDHYRETGWLYDTPGLRERHGRRHDNDPAPRPG